MVKVPGGKLSSCRNSWELRTAAATIKVGEEFAYDQDKLDADIEELDQVRVPTEAPLGLVGVFVFSLTWRVLSVVS